jgi:hypothetical protein
VFRVASSNVPPALVSMLGLLELRDKSVLALPAKSQRRISVKRGEGPAETVERAKDGSVWRLGEGMSGQVSAARVAALGRSELRHLLHTGHAGRCPEVHQRDLPAQVGQAHALALDIDQRHVGGVRF